MDAIGEVKLLVSNYTAEYGGRTGGQLTFTTKNGTPQFHGSAFYYWRHEMFNANEWFNNKLAVNGVAVEKPKYRYQNPGGTIGGPLIIPGTRFNKSRTKLFFFFSATTCATGTPSQHLHHALRAGAPGRFLADCHHDGHANSNPGPDHAGRICKQQDSYQPNQPGGPRHVEPVSAADPAGLGLDTTGQRRFNFRAILPQLRPNEDKILRVDYNLGRRPPCLCAS